MVHCRGVQIPGALGRLGLVRRRPIFVGLRQEVAT
jgi:hypothetical protein